MFVVYMSFMYVCGLDGFWLNPPRDDYAVEIPLESKRWVFQPPVINNNLFQIRKRYVFPANDVAIAMLDPQGPCRRVSSAYESAIRSQFCLPGPD